jgi:membrane dipeptidase
MENQGVVMVCCLRELVDPEGGAHATRKQVADHIVYVGETIGYDHVGIGSDFDGMLEGPDGLDDVSQFPALVEDLLLRGVSESDIQKILGLNILRVLKQVEDIALQERMIGSTKPLCDAIDLVWTPEQREILRAQGEKRGLCQADDAR